MCTDEPNAQQGDVCYFSWMTTANLYESQVACCESVGCDATTTTTTTEEPTTTTEEPAASTTTATTTAATTTTTTAAVSYMRL